MAKLFAERMQKVPAASVPVAGPAPSEPPSEAIPTARPVPTSPPTDPTRAVEAPDWAMAPIVPPHEEPRQLNVNVRRRHLRILDRYFQKLYNTRNRVTKGQLVMLAVEMVEIVLGGEAPATFEPPALLEKYLKRKTEREAST